MSVNTPHQGTPDGRSIALAYVTGQDALVNVAGGNIVRGTCKNQSLRHIVVASIASTQEGSAAELFFVRMSSAALTLKSH